jgi:phytoene synthase
MNVLYAYLRVTDDIADDEDFLDRKRTRLAAWRTRLMLALNGVPSHRVHAALAAVVQHFHIPVEYLSEVIDGVESDLETVSFGTFADLEFYCYRVAGVVGLACIHIWGWNHPEDELRFRKPALAAGTAFQLTNILRDLAEDAESGRVYLPRDELAEFQVDPSRWHLPEQAEPFAKLLAFQVERARELYTRSRELDAMLCPAGRAVFVLMRDAYESVLTQVEKAGQGLLRKRVRLGTLSKLRLLVRSWS